MELWNSCNGSEIPCSEPTVQSTDFVSPLLLVGQLQPQLPGQLVSPHPYSPGQPNAQPQLVITEQPAREHRFRYITEGASHGNLSGRTLDQFPSVKLCNYPADGTACVRACLFTMDRQRRHFHKLVGGNCDEHGQCQTDVDHNNECVFRNLGIKRTGKSGITDTLLQEQMDRIGHMVSDADLKLIIKQLRQDMQKMQLNHARLCFQALHKQSGHPIGNCVFSEPIFNTKAGLRIEYLSKDSFVCTGGDEICLLCSKIEKKDIIVRFYEIDMMNDVIIWQHLIDQQNLYIHHQAAIKFNVPPFRDRNITRPVNVFIQLCSKKGRDSSDSVEFTYKPVKKDRHCVCLKMERPCNSEDFFNPVKDPRDIYRPGGPDQYSSAGCSGHHVLEGKDRSRRAPLVPVCSPVIHNQWSHETYRPSSVSSNNGPAFQPQQRVFSSVFSPQNTFPVSSNVNTERTPQMISPSQPSNVYLLPPAPSPSSRPSDVGSPASNASVGRQYWAHTSVASPETQFNSAASLSARSASVKVPAVPSPESPYWGPSPISFQDDLQIINEIIESHMNTNDFTEEVAMDAAFKPMLQNRKPEVMTHGKPDSIEPNILEKLSSLEIGSSPLKENESIYRYSKSTTEDKQSTTEAFPKRSLDLQLEERTEPRSVTRLNEASSEERKKASEEAYERHNAFVEEEMSPKLSHYLRRFIRTGKIDSLLWALSPIISFANCEGDNALHLAVLHQSKNEDLFDQLEPALRTLQPHDTINNTNNLYQTPLHLAVLLRARKVVEHLLNNGADPNFQDQDGNTPFHLAVLNRDPVSLGVLLRDILKPDDKGSDVKSVQPKLNILNYDSYSALHLCITTDTQACMSLLLDAGADPNVRSGCSGQTPLHLAMQRRSYLISYLLKQPGINVDAQDYGGRSPLQWAVISDSAEMVFLLMEANADPYIPNFQYGQQNKEDSSDDLTCEDDEGETAFDLASEQPQLLRLLKGTATSEEISALRETLGDWFRKNSPSSGGDKDDQTVDS